MGAGHTPVRPALRPGRPRKEFQTPGPLETGLRCHPSLLSRSTPAHSGRESSRTRGWIALAGLNLAGAHLANVVTLEPPEIRFAGQTVSLGRVIGSPRKRLGDHVSIPKENPIPCEQGGDR
jgi:hypothetical protein